MRAPVPVGMMAAAWSGAQRPLMRGGWRVHDVRGGGDESTLAAERDRWGPDLTSQNRGGAGTAPAPN